MTAPEVPLDHDLVSCINSGLMDEWQAMQTQTCRDAAYARAMVDELQKKIVELGQEDPAPEPPQKTCPIRIVARG